MKIRKPKNKELIDIKKFVDSFPEVESDEHTYSVDYLSETLEKGILFIAETNEQLVGCIFGRYSKEDKWADLLVIVVKKNFQKKGIGKELLLAFEEVCNKKGIISIDTMANKSAANLFHSANYTPGRTYISFQKKLT